MFEIIAGYIVATCILIWSICGTALLVVKTLTNIKIYKNKKKTFWRE